MERGPVERAQVTHRKRRVRLLTRVGTVGAGAMAFGLAAIRIWVFHEPWVGLVALACAFIALSGAVVSLGAGIDSRPQDAPPARFR